MHSGTIPRHRLRGAGKIADRQSSRVGARGGPPAWACSVVCMLRRSMTSPWTVRPFRRGLA